MIHNQKLIELVTKVNNKKRTGKLRVGTHSQAGLDRKLLIATLFFNEGQLYDCEYDNQSGNRAVTDLINAPMVSTIFIQCDISAVSEKSFVPNVDTFLAMVKRQIMDKTPPPFDPSDLTRAAAETLREFCGKRAGKLIEDLIVRFPPAQNPKIFVRECVNIASDFIGVERAREKLKPLYSLI